MNDLTKIFMIVFIMTTMIALSESYQCNRIQSTSLSYNHRILTHPYFNLHQQRMSVNPSIIMSSDYIRFHTNKNHHYTSRLIRIEKRIGNVKNNIYHQCNQLFNMMSTLKFNVDKHSTLFMTMLSQLIYNIKNFDFSLSSYNINNNNNNNYNTNTNNIITCDKSATTTQSNGIFEKFKTSMISLLLGITLCLGISIKPSYARSTKSSLSNNNNLNNQQTITKVISSSHKLNSRNNKKEYRKSSSSNNNLISIQSSSNTIVDTNHHNQNDHNSHSSSNEDHSKQTNANSNNDIPHDSHITKSDTKSDTKKSSFLSKTFFKKKPSKTAPKTLLEHDSDDHEAVVEVKSTFRTLLKSLEGAKLDTLIVLLVSSAVVPLFKRLNISPIVGFLLAGT